MKRKKPTPPAVLGIEPDRAKALRRAAYSICRYANASCACEKAERGHVCEAPKDCAANVFRQAHDFFEEHGLGS